MSLVDLARGAVVRTNQWPGLKTLYGQAYELGLAFTVNRFKSVPGILAIMLRAAEGGRAWVPGLSDYDLTVLVRRHDGPPMIGFLDQLWHRYRSIKRSVPQLGEMEVMDVHEYGDFLAFGPTSTASLKRAYPLFVRSDNGDVERVLQQVPRSSQQREFLLDALSRYTRFTFPAWLDDASSSTGVTRRRAEHLLSNIAKRLARLGVPAEATATGTVADRMLQVVRHLSRACGLIERRDGEPGTIADPCAPLIADDAVLPLQVFCEKALRQARVHRCSAIAWISYMSVDRLNLAFVMPDDAPEDELRRLLVTLGALHRTVEVLSKRVSLNDELQLYFPSLACPVVVSESMWRCWRELSPFDGVAIAATGRTLMGASSRQTAPSRTALMRGAEVQYAALLPLKNNWRPLHGPGTPRLYAAMVNHVKGYASATTGRVLAVPAALEFTSTQEGYLAAVEELRMLRACLTISCHAI